MSTDNTNELVRFYKQSNPFNPGEIGGLKPRDAHRAVALGLAVYVNPPDGVNEQGVADATHAKDVDPNHYDAADPIYKPPADENLPAW